jgi:hypothetical protein
VETLDGYRWDAVRARGGRAAREEGIDDHIIRTQVNGKYPLNLSCDDTGLLYVFMSVLLTISAR